jgi:UDP-glucose:(heptosyl)LPS alpha-1,3-glucosyltransferase
VADDFVRFHRVPDKQIVVIYNGVDCERFSPNNRSLHRNRVRRMLQVEDDTVLLLLVGHNFRLKGLPELLSVAARLIAHRRRIHVVVVGGKRLKKWQIAAARYGVAQHVTFAGTVSDVAPYYAAADVYIQPTYYDPCSLVLLEAAACGLPIITTRRHNGAAELFRDGRDILNVCDPYDLDALYERIEALFDERLRDQLGASARAVAERHPFERNMSEIVRLYDRQGRKRVAA